MAGAPVVVRMAALNSCGGVAGGVSGACGEKGEIGIVRFEDRSGLNGIGEMMRVCVIATVLCTVLSC